MTALWNDLAAVFFTSRGKAIAHESLSTLLCTAGARELQTDLRVADLLSNTWAGLPCQGVAMEGDEYQVLWISFSQDSLAHQLYPRPEDERVESEPGLLVAQAFRDACDAVEADVGMFLTHNWQASDEWVASQEWAVAGLFSIHLRSQGIGLLYLNEERVRAQPAHSLLDQNDQMPARCGRLYFSGHGRGRWP